MVACCHFCVWLWWAVSSETTFYKHGVKTNLASRPHLHSDWGKRRKLVQMWSQQLPHLLVKVHVLHLGFEQLHFIHGDGVLKAVLSSCRIISILLLCIHVEYRTGAGKNMTTRKRGRERERKRKKERKRERVRRRQRVVHINSAAVSHSPHWLHYTFHSDSHVCVFLMVMFFHSSLH